MEPDYLFSIVNPWILPPEVLRRPRRLAINYHDSPLPAYPGYHSTSWALLAGETAHGISWHVMAERVDSGDLLRCSRIPIAPGETAFSLNMKCYEAALTAFGALVDAMEADRLERRPQPPGRRCFHRRAERPAVGGVLSWQRSAEELDRLVRALDFGGTANTLLCPKLAAGDRFVLVHRLEILPSSSGTAPGTITGLTPDALQVTTTTRDIALSELATIDGKPLAAGRVAAALRLRPGGKLPELAAATAERLTRLSSELAPHEAHWLERLARLAPLALPPRSDCTPRGEAVTLPLRLPAALAARPEWTERREEAAALLATAFGRALSRAFGRASFDIGFRCSETSRDTAGLEGFFAAYVPLRLDLAGSGEPGAAPRIRQEIAAARRHRTYARDLTARHPLPWRDGAGDPPRLEVAIAAGPAPTPARGAGAPAVVLVLGDGPDAGSAHLRCAAAPSPTEWARQLGEQCERWLDEMAGAPRGAFVPV